MDCVQALPKTLSWKYPLIPLLSDDPRTNIPLYGPLNIQNYKHYLEDGKQIFKEYYLIKCPRRAALEEFDFICTLAEGGFGQVLLAQQKDEEGSLYAVKAVDKLKLVENKGLLATMQNEKRLLQGLQCPFCIRLEYVSQSKSHLYMFLPFVSGGDLFTHLRNVKTFEEHVSKFYAAQVVMAIEFMQNCDIVHRDIKPENILIDHYGFIKLTDFGLAKVVPTRTYTFCGTVDYTAPEVILGKGYGKAVDWWGLGVLNYEMNAGKVPFLSDNELDMFELILLTEYKMPEHFSAGLKTFVHNLLQRDPSQRMGNLRLGAEEVKSHPWFSGIDWLQLLNRMVVPPYVPQNPKKLSNVNFPNITPLPGNISDKFVVDRQFEGF